MRSLLAWMTRIVGMVSRTRRDRSCDPEHRAKLQLQANDHERNGLSADAARRTALLEMGGIEPTIERYRDRGALPWLDAAVHNLKYALRGGR